MQEVIITKWSFSDIFQEEFWEWIFTEVFNQNQEDYQESDFVNNIFDSKTFKPSPQNEETDEVEDMYLQIWNDGIIDNFKTIYFNNNPDVFSYWLSLLSDEDFDLFLKVLDDDNIQLLERFIVQNEEYQEVLEEISEIPNNSNYNSDFLEFLNKIDEEKSDILMLSNKNYIILGGFKSKLVKNQAMRVIMNRGLITKKLTYHSNVHRKNAYLYVFEGLDPKFECIGYN